MDLNENIEELDLKYYRYLPKQKMFKHDKKDLSENYLIGEMIYIVNKICTKHINYTIDNDHNIILH
ncbi:MAG: hypothetical protein HRT43_03540 [Campylobacteraceae bacterium]|nr:hypothetical protein [Campylobacteraceae bacterium]